MATACAISTSVGASSIAAETVITKFQGSSWAEQSGPAWLSSYKHGGVSAAAQRRPVVTCRHRPAVACPLFPRSMEAYRGISGQAATLVAPSLVQEQLQIVPVPVVYIDVVSDADATLVELRFGNRLKELVEHTSKALEDLGFNVSEGPADAAASDDGTPESVELCITRGNGENACKVRSAELLEAIRLTTLGTLLKYHPEASSQLALGKSSAIANSSAKQVSFINSKTDGIIATRISITEPSNNSERSLLTVVTADRPGLPLAIVKIIKELDLDAEPAEIDTEGLAAKLAAASVSKLNSILQPSVSWLEVFNCGEGPCAEGRNSSWTMSGSEPS